jgi:hypothetical protein
LVTSLGGLLLAGTSCFGFFVSLGGNFERGGNDVFTPLTAIGFGVGVVTLMVGMVFVLMRTLRAMMDKGSSAPSPPTPPYPPPPPPPPPTSNETSQ